MTTEGWLLWVVLKMGAFAAFEVSQEACLNVATAVTAGQVVEIEDSRGIMFPIARAICLPPIDQRPCEGELACVAPKTGPTS